jgi:hypothetical protein
MTQTRSAIAPRWQDVISFLLGVWLFVSPWILGYANTGMPATLAWLLGIIVVVLAALAILASQRWEEWLNAAIGLWIFVSPWVVHARVNREALWNSLIVGALLVILSLWSLSIDPGPGEVSSTS